MVFKKPLTESSFWIKTIKDMRQVFYRNAHAAICNINANSGALAAGCQANLAALRCILQRITEQIEQHLHQQLPLSRRRST